ncbi:MAG: glycosyltransferase family 39 protein [Candidatus Nanoarchaeia archaeon]
MDNEKLKGNIKEFLKDNQNKLLIVLIAFATLFRLYYFFKLGAQPIWWDEGDYLAVAKGFLLNWQTQEWWAHFSGIRPLLMPMLWALFLKLNLSEIIMRFFTLFIPSIITVYLTYAIGRDLYNKKVGLIAGLMMSVYWVQMFYTFRLLTDIPALCLSMFSIYFFWSWYIKKEKPIGLYLCILFGVLGFSTRFPLAMVPFTCIFYLFITKRFSLLKDKIIWKASIIGIGLLLFYFIMASLFGSGILNAIQFYFGSKAVSMGTPVTTAFKDIMLLIPSLLEKVWLVAVFIGLITFINLVLGFDLFLKRKNKELDSDFFVFIWAFLQLFLYIVIVKSATDRWLLMLMPALFIIAAKGTLLIYDYLKKYNKEIAIVALLIFVGGGFYEHFTHTNQLIDMKIGSYGEEKEAGIWIKENFVGIPKIMTASTVQIAYYSEGYTYGFSTNATEYTNCVDKMGAIVDNESCQNITETLFDEKVKEVNPDFFIIHIFEPVFTPKWAYTYAEKHRNQLTPVQAYFADEQKTQPMLILYKYNK